MGGLEEGTPSSSQTTTSDIDVEDAEAKETTEEREVEQYVAILSDSNVEAEEKLESLRKVRSLIKQVEPVKVLRMCLLKYIDALNAIISIPVSLLVKEAVYNLFSIL